MDLHNRTITLISTQTLIGRGVGTFGDGYLEKAYTLFTNKLLHKIPNSHNFPQISSDFSQIILENVELTFRISNILGSQKVLTNALN
jgi:hypothetical protein